MQCDIYEASSKAMFLFVKHGTPPSDVIPLSLQKELDTLTLFKTKELIEETPLVGANPKDIIKRITEHGYALQSVEVKTSISEVGTAVGAGILVASLGATLPITIAVSAGGFVLAHLFKGQKND
ncbi:YcgL domain-containing protein [Micavibrio aeruginosavorus]|uniref:YcgL domain-containing protein n=1 Tax=Micavibrio aeruginosavorus TaxID=349221 RepID=UPI003F4A984F